MIYFTTIVNFITAFFLLFLSCMAGRSTQYGFVKFSDSSNGFFLVPYKGSRYLNIDAAPDSGRIFIHEVAQGQIVSGIANFSQPLSIISEGYYSRPDWTLKEKKVLNISQLTTTNCKENPVYHNITKRLFLERNLPVETVVVSNCIILDLNVDKTDEVLLIAQNYDNPTDRSFINKIAVKRNPELFQLISGFRYFDHKSGNVKEKILNRFEINNLFSDTTGFAPHYAETVEIRCFRNPLGKGAVLIYRPVFQPKAAGASCRAWIVSYGTNQFYQAEGLHYRIE